MLGSRPPVSLGMPGPFFLAFSGGMPMALAVSMIFCGPSGMARVRSMNAVLMESWVAWSRLTALPSCASPWFSNSLPSGATNGELPSKVSLSE